LRKKALTELKKYSQTRFTLHVGTSLALGKKEVVVLVAGENKLQATHQFNVPPFLIIHF
jgi:hypothetical protein